MSYLLKIEVISDTIFAGTEGNAVVDSTTRYQKNGLPFIPAKTIKGLVKESFQETLEILNQPNDLLIERLFGKEGAGNNGILEFSLAEVSEKQKYEELIDTHLFTQTEVLDFFTYLRHQTAMENGVAKQGSLRTLRVLKPQLEFISIIEGELNEVEFGLLSAACKNLRRSGTNRNRGFGRIKLELSELQEDKSLDFQSQEINGNIYKISLLKPALLPIDNEDENLVKSSKIIPGRKLLGMFTKIFLSQYTGDKNMVHNDVDFKQLFLDGSVRFSNAYPLVDGKISFPNGLHWMIDKAETEVYNDFEKIGGDINKKGLSGIFTHDGIGKADVKSSLEFHNSRNKEDFDPSKTNPSRVKGSNQGEGIFYYETLEPNQEFIFKIEGKSENIIKINELLSHQINLRIGKSVSTDLGKIKVEPCLNIWPKIDETSSQIMTFVSPVILKNEYGEYVASLNGLSKALQINIDPMNARIRMISVQVFQGKISMQLPEMVAIAPGSSISFSEIEIPKNILENSCVGEFTHEGYGQYFFEGSNKKENLSNLIKKTKENRPSDSTEHEDSKPNVPIGDHEFEKYIIAQREIISAKKIALKNSKGKILNKNATMLMLSLCKSVYFNIMNGKRFKDALNENLQTLGKDGFSEKVINSLSELFGKTKDNEVLIKERKKMKKSDTNDFELKFNNFIKSIFKIEKSEFTTDQAIINYWITYYNNIKINNRNAK